MFALACPAKPLEDGLMLQQNRCSSVQNEDRAFPQCFGSIRENIGSHSSYSSTNGNRMIHVNSCGGGLGSLHGSSHCLNREDIVNYHLSSLNRDEKEKSNSGCVNPKRDENVNQKNGSCIVMREDSQYCAAIASDGYSQRRTNSNRSTIVKNIIILNEGIRIIDPLLSHRKPNVHEEGLRPVGNMVKLGSGGAFSLVQKEDAAPKEICEPTQKKPTTPTQEEPKEARLNQSSESIGGLTDSSSTSTSPLLYQNNPSSHNKENLGNESVVTTAAIATKLQSPDLKKHKISLKSIMNEFPESPRNSKLVFKANRFSTTIVQQISRRPSRTIFSTTLSTGPLSSAATLVKVSKSTSPKKGISKIMPGAVNPTANFKIRKISQRSDNCMKKVYQF